ncbi:uncharacterized protein LOC112203389 [Rosa chinensis]|uniref:uncharacterized protein LOC112203389 n=1 Tax=Rosa chinensis TaxID=74649 RepID=UPI000D089D1C|nr:uncharacterized protein LOC112203389 [Rosa chinensis]
MDLMGSSGCSKKRNIFGAPSPAKDNRNMTELMNTSEDQTFQRRFKATNAINLENAASFVNILDPIIDDADNVNLLKPVTMDEIHLPVNSIGPLKAPGPDGIHAMFYQKHWDLVKDKMSDIVLDFFQNNTSLRLLNHTNIALIPKVESPEIVSHFRPISLCNVVYKVISKILIARLKRLLVKCISRNQGAFAPGRSIVDNILIAHELFSSFNKKKATSGSMAIKLDLEKAYDSLDWNYIKLCLHRFGFDVKWINLIMDCISSVTFSILINGKHLNYAASNSKNHVGILSSPGGYRISNLMVADGYLIFVRATNKAANNKDPLNAKELLLKISNKLSGWKKATLSRAGKLTLIKSNIAGMPNHVMSCFKCPPKVTKAIDKETRSFFWGKDCHCPPVAWNQICLPKSLDGLGIRLTTSFNKAALAKLGWKVISDHDNWWVDIVRRNSGDEDINHLFFSCPFAANVWRSAGRITENLLLLCWNIWEARNNLIFRHSSSLPNMVVHAAASIGENYGRNNPCHFKGPTSIPQVIRWLPLPVGFAKLNFDGSVVNNKKASSGFVIRDHDGSPSLLVREPLVMLLSPLLKEVQSVMVFIMRSTLTVESFMSKVAPS